MSKWPFNADGPRNQWMEINADGFPDPVPGCVYDGHRLDGGIPLGGLGTGYFTLEGSGLNRPLFDIQRHRPTTLRLLRMADGQDSGW